MPFAIFMACDRMQIELHSFTGQFETLQQQICGSDSWAVARSSAEWVQNTRKSRWQRFTPSVHALHAGGRDDAKRRAVQTQIQRDAN